MTEIIDKKILELEAKYSYLNNKIMSMTNILMEFELGLDFLENRINDIEKQLTELKHKYRKLLIKTEKGEEK